MPAIILINPEDAGSLTAKPNTEQEKQEAKFWNDRAFIMKLGKNIDFSFIVKNKLFRMIEK